MSTPHDETSELRRLEEELWREETRFDRSRMQALLAEDFFEVGRSGRVYRRDDVLAVPAQEIPATLPLPGLRVRLLRPDVALVTYETELAHASGTQRARRSSLWTREPGGWRLRYHQGTPIPGDGKARG